MERTKTKTSIPGTKLSVNNTQLLISSGIPSFDGIVGGGLPVGTITLIEEDACAIYSKLMLQYFLAEGIVTGHSAFVASQEMNSTILVSCLPSVITTEEETQNQPKDSSENDDELKIAWRYKNLPTSNAKQNKFGHYYDLSKQMDPALMEKADIKCWSYLERSSELIYTFSNPAYHELLGAIKAQIDNGGFFLKSKNVCKSVLRVAIQSIGSPLWFSNNTNLTQCHDIEQFLYCLRALVRSSLVSVLLTIPSKVMEEASVDRCLHASDIVIRLQSFSGTGLESNSALADYQGFFHVVKLPALNTLAPKDLGPVDYAFKLRRKKFVVEELHLPPELQESSEREQDEIPSMGCGSSSKHLLEF